jgi:hypothetical protein
MLASVPMIHFPGLINSFYQQFKREERQALKDAVIESKSIEELAASHQPM